MMSATMAETCVVVAEVTGDAALVSKLGANEAARARERCLSRAERSIDAYQGHTLRIEDRRLLAWFPRCDSAILAANDMLARVGQLPPVSGVSLAVRIGVHSGAFDTASKGPTAAAIDLVTNLVSVASPGQVLLSGEAAMHLSEAARSQIDTQTQLSISAAGYDLPVYELKNGALKEGIFATQSQMNLSTIGSAEPVGRSDTPRSRLLLRFASSSYVVSEIQPVLLAGREEGNDIVINDRRASRHHARVEWREGRYVLIDNSTNGTYLIDDSGVEIVLRRGECDMPARGRIGLGFSPSETDTESIMFDLGQR